MKYKAVFFDRDNTITKRDVDAYQKFKIEVENFTQKPYVMNREKMFAIFEKLKTKGYNCSSYENEVEFYKHYYQQLLTDECGFCDETVAKKAEELFNLMWLKERTLFEEVKPLFAELKSRGLKIGIISDTTPSLQKTLEVLGLGEYIDSYTCSELVGVMKPEPEMYLTALKSLNLKAEECIYVDDYLPEVLGAKNLGFLSFRINRKKEDVSDCDISTLTEILKFI